LLKSFAPFGKQMGGLGGDAGTSFLKGLTQRLNNFKAGKAFALDVDVDTKGIKNRFNEIRTDWDNLLTAFREPIPQPTTLGFEKINDELVVTSIAGKTTGETVSLELSKAGTAAIVTSEACEEIGEDLTKSGLEGKVALDLI
jgi:hypothetical protein